MIIPYLGEKSKFSSFITPNIPTDISTYVEPFGGSFGVYFSLKLKDIKYVYNDSNHLNHNLFKQLQNEKFIELVKSTKVDKEFYKKSLYNLENSDKLQLALDWLVVLTCSSPREIGKDSWKGSGEFNMFKLKWFSYKKKINNITDILNLDYKEVITKYDSESTFFYLDPPYMGREGYYLNHNFNKESHKELSIVLNNIKGKFILSYFYFDGLNELYPDCKFEFKKTLMGTEYIISNY
jgi:DNA adenine methylase